MYHNILTRFDISHGTIRGRAPQVNKGEMGRQLWALRSVCLLVLFAAVTGAVLAFMAADSSGQEKGLWVFLGCACSVAIVISLAFSYCAWCLGDSGIGDRPSGAVLIDASPSQIPFIDF